MFNSVVTSQFWHQDSSWFSAINLETTLKIKYPTAKISTYRLEWLQKQIEQYGLDKVFLLLLDAIQANHTAKDTIKYLTTSIKLHRHVEQV